MHTTIAIINTNVLHAGLYWSSGFVRRITWKNVMCTLNLKLPDSIHHKIKEIAKREGVSINLFISSAVSEKISAILTEEYIEQRKKRARKGAFKKVLDRVPSRKPMQGDEL